MLWAAGACGLVFIAILVVQLVVPDIQLFWLAVPFGVAGGLLARSYTMSRR
jgi:hypothetical protein